MNTFETVVDPFAIGRDIARPGSDEPEYRNAVFNFENGVVLSIGFGSNHYTTPRGFQGLHPRREVVEVAVLNRDREFITREFYDHAFGGERELYDDVVSEDTANFFSILRLVEEFAALDERNEVDEHDRFVSESSQREVDAIADDRFYGI
tara:strand:- start:10605 stop:11054 length:450 start_codon:yes stop_codon:yes gene_type:complete